MKTFVVTAADTARISTLFPCTNRPSNPEVVNARSSGSQEHNKVVEFYFDPANPPDRVAITVTFPPPNVNRPQVWSLRNWIGFPDRECRIEEEEEQFRLFLPKHNAPFLFPKAPMHDATIIRIREAFQIPEPELV